MQSLTTCARLVARALSGTEAESFLYNSLIRLSTSSSIHQSPSTNSSRHTISSSPAVTRAVHLITATSGYSKYDDEEDESKGHSQKQKKSSKIQRSSLPNVFGDDAYFIAKNRLGDFLGKSSNWIIESSFVLKLLIRCCRRCWRLARIRNRSIVILEFSHGSMSFANR